MSQTKRRLWLAVLGIVAIPVVGVALAWACTPSAEIRISPSSGPPGTEVTVSGNSFKETVEISVDGQPIGSASGPEFTVTIAMPRSLSPGVHYVVAESPPPAGGTASSAFGVTAQAATPEAGAGEGTAPPGGPAAAPNAGPAADRSPGAGSRGRTHPARGRGAEPGTSTGRPRGEKGVQTGAPGARPRTAQARGGASGRARTASGKVVFAGSLSKRARRSGKSAVPSERVAAADVWSGFTSGGGGLVPRLTAPTAVGSGPGSELRVAVGLLGLGLAGLLAGLWIAASRRRVRGRGG